MNYLLLIFIIFAMSLQGVFQKQYNIKTNSAGAFIFSSVSMLFAALVFVITSGFKLSFNAEVLPYCILFALFFGMAILFTFLAVREGSLSFTSLASSYSLVIPTLSGIVLYNETVSTFFFVGLVSLLLSLVLINEYKDGKRFTAKWVVFAVLAFIGNGFCSTVQTYQQRVFNGAYKSELMIIALLLVSVFFFIMSFVKEKSSIKLCTQKGWLLMAAYGFSIGIVNLLVMVLSRRMNVSVMFPLISAGGLVVTSLISIIIYKEKLTKKQYLGLILGVFAVVFINL